MDWILELWRDYGTGGGAFWRRSTFWLVVAALVLPFGSVLFVLKLEPVRVRLRAFYRS